MKIKGILILTVFLFLGVSSFSLELIKNTRMPALCVEHMSNCGVGPMSGPQYLYTSERGFGYFYWDSTFGVYNGLFQWGFQGRPHSVYMDKGLMNMFYIYDDNANGGDNVSPGLHKVQFSTGMEIAGYLTDDIQAAVTISQFADTVENTYIIVNGYLQALDSNLGYLWGSAMPLGSLAMASGPVKMIQHPDREGIFYISAPGTYNVFAVDARYESGHNESPVVYPGIVSTYSIQDYTFLGNNSIAIADSNSVIQQWNVTPWSGYETQPAYMSPTYDFTWSNYLSTIDRIESDTDSTRMFCLSQYDKKVISYNYNNQNYGNEYNVSGDPVDIFINKHDNILFITRKNQDPVITDLSSFPAINKEFIIIDQTWAIGEVPMGALSAGGNTVIFNGYNTIQLLNNADDLNPVSTYAIYTSTYNNWGSKGKSSIALDYDTSTDHSTSQNFLVKNGNYYTLFAAPYSDLYRDNFYYKPHSMMAEAYSDIVFTDTSNFYAFGDTGVIMINPGNPGSISSYIELNYFMSGGPYAMDYNPATRQIVGYYYNAGSFLFVIDATNNNVLYDGAMPGSYMVKDRFIQRSFSVLSKENILVFIDNNDTSFLRMIKLNSGSDPAYLNSYSHSSTTINGIDVMGGSILVMSDVNYDLYLSDVNETSGDLENTTYTNVGNHNHFQCFDTNKILVNTSKTDYKIYRHINLSAPYNLTGSAPNYHTVSLSWSDDNNNEYGYKVFYRTYGTADWNAPETTSIPSYTRDDLMENTTYEFMVRSYNDICDSPDSNIFEITTPGSVEEESKFLLGPNPTHQYLNLAGLPIGTKIRILSQSGHDIIRTFNISMDPTTLDFLNDSILTPIPGIYYLVLVYPDDKKPYVHPFIYIPYEGGMK